MIEIRGLTKRYGGFTALRGLDLTANPGEVYGFLGRNGAGKTTTIRILMGITRATSGSFRLFGEDVGRDHLRFRQRIGYVAQEQNFYGWMTPLALGRFVRGFYPTWDDAEYDRLLRTMGLPFHRKVREFSGGMKAKQALALALAHRPELLILDEPTAGLDPVARREFLEMVRQQAEQSGRTTFFSSHLLGEVERAADRVGIIDDGKTIYEGGLRELSDQVRLLRAPESVELPLELVDAASGFVVLQDRTRKGEHELVVRHLDPERVKALAPEGWRVETLSLEDMFIELVSKPGKIGAAT